MALETFAAIAAENPERSPTWRYERALTIHEKLGGRWHRQRDDQLTIDCSRYLAQRAYALRQDISPMDMDALLHGRYRRIHQAYKIFGLQSTNPNRYVLEARLLAGQSNEQIQAKSGIPADTAGIYEQLFFNVRDRLELLDYILNNAIGKVFQSGLTSFNPELLAKYFGYLAGPVVLEMVLYGFASKRNVANDDEILGFLDDQIARTTRMQTATLTTLLQPGKFDIRAIFEGYNQLLAVEARHNASPEHSEWVASLVKILAKNFPIPRGSAAKNLEGTPVANYSVGTVELRASEQLRAVSQQGLPYYDQLAKFTVPDPDSQQNAKQSQSN